MRITEGGILDREAAGTRRYERGREMETRQWKATEDTMICHT